MRKRNRIGKKQTRGSKINYEWKQAVYKRDNFICQYCGSNENLCAHHIVEWDKDETLRFDINNGITLCNKCHRAEHNKRNKYKKGMKNSEETRKKISIALKGRYPSELCNQKRIEATKGKPSKKKGIKSGIIPWNKGLTYKLSKPNKNLGKKHSEEHKEKIRQGMIAANKNKEYMNAKKLRYKEKKWIINEDTGKRQWID